MSRAIDRAYLKQEQYPDATNLNARILLHQRFGTGKVDWQTWVFDHFLLPSDARILELGCGPGRLSAQNRDRLPAGWEVTLSDLSAGMVEQARQHLAETGHRFDFNSFDAQAIPYAGGGFDAVIAGHMLFHVPARQKTYAEIKRVLKPSGVFYATTNSRDNMRQVMELEDSLGIMGGVKTFLETTDFHLENGEAELAAWFPHVTLHRQEEALLVTEAQPLIAYILSVMGGSGLSAETLDRLRERIEAEVKDQGAFRIDRISGLFVAEMREPLP